MMSLQQRRERDWRATGQINIGNSSGTPDTCTQLSYKAKLQKGAMK